MAKASRQAPVQGGLRTREKGTGGAMGLRGPQGTVSARKAEALMQGGGGERLRGRNTDESALSWT